MTESQKKSNEHSEKRSGGYTFWSRMSETVGSRFGKLFGSSLIGRYLTSYQRFESAAKNSYLATEPGRIVHRERKRRYRPQKEVGTEKLDRHLKIYNASTLRQPIGKRFRRVVGGNRIVGGLIGFLKELPFAPVSAVGTLFFSMGVCAALMQIFRIVLGVDIASLFDTLITGFLLLIISAPMINKSGISIYRYVLSGRLGGDMLLPLLGISEKKAEREARMAEPIRMNLIACFTGIICGLFTLHFRIWFVLFGLLFLLAALMTFFVPEFGMMVLLFALPFVGLSQTCGLLFTAFSVIVLIAFLLNVLVGRRVVHFQPFDFVVLFLSLYVILSEYRISGDYMPDTMVSVLLIGLLLYFLSKNMLTSRSWIECSVGVLIASATVVSAFGIVQALLGLRMGITSFFATSEQLGCYLLLTGFFTLCALRRKTFGKIPLLLSGEMQLACLILTASKPIVFVFWIGLLIYLGLLGKKVFRFVLLALLALPIAIPFLPAEWTEEICSTLILQDGGWMRRLEIWKNSIMIGRDSFFCGIGLSEEHFSDLYSVYAAGSAVPTAENPSGLYLGILIGVGIFGLFLFGAAILLFVRMTVSFYHSVEGDHDLISVHLAGFSGIVSLLLAGFLLSVWSCEANFWLFSLIIGFLVAIRNTVQEERTRYRDDLTECSGEIILEYASA